MLRIERSNNLAGEKKLEVHLEQSCRWKPCLIHYHPQKVTLTAEPLCSSPEPRTVTHKPLPDKVVPYTATNLSGQEGE